MKSKSNFLTKCLHVVIKVLAVHQFPRSTESLNHFCKKKKKLFVQLSNCQTISALPAVNLTACLPAKLILQQRDTRAAP